MDERAFYIEAPTTRTAELVCPHCRTTASYELRWVVRRKKNRAPEGADERDRIRFAKAQSYMVLAEDKVTCANGQCRRTFEISGIKTMAFLNPEQEAAVAQTAPQAARQQARQQSKKKKAKAKHKKSAQAQHGQKKQPKQKKKKKPKVYFPSDYIHYRP